MKGKRSRRQLGFTIIELIISLVIVAIIMVGLLTAMRSFGITEEKLDKRLVLVDDVYTTGATVSAATTALKKAGAQDVTVLTFARALAGPI